MEELSNSSNSLEVIEMNGQPNESNEENVQDEVDSSSTDGEEGILMTEAEALELVSKKIRDMFNDPNKNPLLSVKLEILEYQKNIKLKAEELEKTCKSIELLYKHQVKFLQHQGLMAKPQTRSVGVGIDLPFLPETLNSILNDTSTRRTGISGQMKSPAKQLSSGAVECIDLTDDVAPSSSVKQILQKKLTASSNAKQATHPAPLPPCQERPDILQKPQLKIKVNLQGIVLTWDMPDRNEEVTSYEIFYYQELSRVQASSSLWKKIVRLDPLALPMSCLLSHLEDFHCYHFAVRAVKTKPGYFSDPVSIMYVRKDKKE